MSITIICSIFSRAYNYLIMHLSYIMTAISYIKTISTSNFVPHARRAKENIFKQNIIQWNKGWLGYVFRERLQRGVARRRKSFVRHEYGFYYENHATCLPHFRDTAAVCGEHLEVRVTYDTARSVLAIVVDRFAADFDC